MFELGEPPEREGRPAAEVAYDLLLENDGKAMLLVVFGNWPGDSLDHMFEFFDDRASAMTVRITV